MNLIIYSKPGCHLCVGLLEKLELIAEADWTIEIRDISTNPDWWERYEYEIPVLYQKLPDAQEVMIPRPAPRLKAELLKDFLRKYVKNA